MTLITPAQDRTLLDLNYTAFDHRIRDLRVIGTWMFGEPAQDPCLVLVPAQRSLNTCTPCIVTTDTAFHWADETCDEVTRAAMALDFCRFLNKDMHRNEDVLQIIDTVNARLYDLLRMPPAPQRPLRHTGHMTLSHEGEVIEQKDVWDV